MNNNISFSLDFRPLQGTTIFNIKGGTIEKLNMDDSGKLIEIQVSGRNAKLSEFLPEYEQYKSKAEKYDKLMELLKDEKDT